MTDARRFVRRNRVDEPIAAAIGLGAGLCAAIAGTDPTGNSVVDFLLVTLSIGVVVWAAASAPWWAPAAACGVGAVIALDPIIAVLGAIGFVGGLAIGIRRQELTVLRTVIAAIAMNVLIRSDLAGFLGLSAIVGVAIGLMLLVSGLRRRPSGIRRPAWIGLAAVAGLVGIALIGLAVSGLAARSDLSAGASLSQQAISTLNDGEYAAAADQFADASQSFERANDRLSGVLALPSRLLPGIAQNVRAGAELSAEAADGTADAAAALESIDPSSLAVVDGAIDLAAIAAVEAPLVQVQDALVGLRQVSDAVESQWLVDRLEVEIAELDDRLDASEPRLENAISAVQLAPQMLGGDESRRYLAMFTTPAEVRGLGGFMGNYAEITVDGGRIDIAAFGRTGDLNRTADDNNAVCTGCPQEYLDLYGRFGANNGAGGTVGVGSWSNITFDPHFPYVAEVAKVLYPQSGGTEIDGVFVMDPYVLEALMTYTGPIEVPELDTVVQPADAAEFILLDQYVLAGDDAESGVHVDALDTLGNAVFEGLLVGSLPPPAEMARDLGPLIEERRLLFWTSDADEQDLLQRTGLLGDIPALGELAGGFSVAVNNAGESKIDTFLEREVQTSLEVVDGQQRLLADVTLTNTAPTSGYPPVVIGNNSDLPTGTSRMQLWFYGPPGLDVVTRDGEPVEMTSNVTAGWVAYGVLDTLASGESASYHLDFALSSPRGADVDGDPVVWWQPLAQR